MSGNGNWDGNRESKRINQEHIDSHTKTLKPRNKRRKETTHTQQQTICRRTRRKKQK